jgi:hypothetical protein
MLQVQGVTLDRSILNCFLVTLFHALVMFHQLLQVFCP